MVRGSFCSIHIMYITHIYQCDNDNQSHDNDLIHAFNSISVFVTCAIRTVKKNGSFGSILVSLSLSLILFCFLLWDFKKLPLLVQVFWLLFQNGFRIQIFYRLSCFTTTTTTTTIYKMFSVKFIHCTVRHTNARKRVEEEDDKTTTMKKEMR